jgi:hypothetical protein
VHHDHLAAGFVRCQDAMRFADLPDRKMRDGLASSLPAATSRAISCSGTAATRPV